MNLTVANPTMTSREIAELTGKEHKHVLRDIEVMFSELEYKINGYVQNWTHPQNGQTYPEFVLPKGLTLTLVSGYNVVMRKRIIDRWLELESSSAVQLPNFNDPVAAARAWADAVESKQAAYAQLEAAKPAIAFVDSYVDATGLKGFRDVAKLLKVKENFLRKFLKDSKIQYELGGKWVAYAQHLDAGRFEMRAGVADNGHAYNNCLFTPKGIQWLAGEIAKDKVAKST